MSEAVATKRLKQVIMALGVVSIVLAASTAYLGVKVFTTTPATITTTETQTTKFYESFLTTSTSATASQTTLTNGSSITQGGNYTCCFNATPLVHPTNITSSLWQGAVLMTTNDKFPIYGLPNLPNATIFTIPKIVQTFNGISYFGSCYVTIHIISVNGTEYTSSIYSVWPMDITFYDPECNSNSPWSQALFKDVRIIEVGTVRQTQP